MALQNDEQSLDSLHSQAHIWNHIFSFINSMSLKCAIQLQIPDIINRHGAPMLLSELVEALSINNEKANFVYRLMRILVNSGFFVKQSLTTNGSADEKEKEGYLLAPASRFLLKEEPLSSQEPKLMQLFNEAMSSDSSLVMSVVLKHCGDVFKTLNSIVDVGGGIGTISKAIAEAFPDVSCISFDLPHVVDGLVGSKNVSYIGGDMFEAIPKADAVLLKWIFHDWSDEECIKILMRCKEAIPSKENGGKVIIIDMVLKTNEGDNELLQTQLFFDMLMMTLLTGRERSKKEWGKLFLDAKFSDYKITPILGLRSLIEVYPWLKTFCFLYNLSADEATTSI